MENYQKLNNEISHINIMAPIDGNHYTKEEIKESIQSVLNELYLATHDEQGFFITDKYALFTQMSKVYKSCRMI